MALILERGSASRHRCHANAPGLELPATLLDPRDEVIK
jgi:hypothetical protein